MSLVTHGSTCLVLGVKSLAYILSMFSVKQEACPFFFFFIENGMKPVGDLPVLCSSLSLKKTQIPAWIAPGLYLVESLWDYSIITGF